MRSPPGLLAPPEPHRILEHPGGPQGERGWGGPGAQQGPLAQPQQVAGSLGCRPPAGFPALVQTPAGTPPVRGTTSQPASSPALG